MNEGECEAQVILVGSDIFKCGRPKGHPPGEPHRATLDAYSLDEAKNPLAAVAAVLEWRDR